MVFVVRMYRVYRDGVREIIIISGCFCLRCIGVYRDDERDYYYYVFFLRCIGYIGWMREIIIIMGFLL